MMSRVYPSVSCRKSTNMSVHTVCTRTKIIRVLSPAILIGHFMITRPSFAISQQPYIDMVNTVPFAESILENDIDAIEKKAGSSEAKEIRKEIRHLQKEIDDLETQEERLGIDAVIDQIKNIQEEIDQIMRLSHLY